MGTSPVGARLEHSFCRGFPHRPWGKLPRQKGAIPDIQEEGARDTLTGHLPLLGHDDGHCLLPQRRSRRSLRLVVARWVG